MESEQKSRINRAKPEYFLCPPPSYGGRAGGGGAWRGGDGGTEGGGGGGRKTGGREGEECHMSLLQNPLVPDLTSVPQANCEALSCTFCC